MPKTAIKLMPDYHCWPLWHHDGVIGNIDPDELGISRALSERMKIWSDTYDSHLALSNPASTTWTKDEESEFDAEGRRIALLLAEEVGTAFDVYYSSRCIPVSELV
jgi:hypothetical protein